MAKERTREEILKENAILWDIANDFNNHFLKMQADCISYLKPDNTECGVDWLVDRILFHLDGPEQRRVQGRLAEMRGFGKEQKGGNHEKG